MRIGRALGTASCLLLSLHAPLPAQQPTMCFRGRPLPRCTGFWLTEFGVAPRLTPEGDDDSPLYTWELGLMKNIGPRHSLGGGLFIEGADDGVGWGIRPRYRRWLNSQFSFEVAPGVVLRHTDYTGVAFSGQVAVNFSDYLALTTTVRVYQHSIYLPVAFSPLGYPTAYTLASRTRAALFGGARLGGLPGTVTGIGVPLAVIVTFLVACRGGCFD